MWFCLEIRSLQPDELAHEGKEVSLADFWLGSIVEASGPKVPEYSGFPTVNAVQVHSPVMSTVLMCREWKITYLFPMNKACSDDLLQQLLGPSMLREIL